jgi:hypothetical protein
VIVLAFVAGVVFTVAGGLVVGAALAKWALGA